MTGSCYHRSSLPRASVGLSSRIATVLMLSVVVFTSIGSSGAQEAASDSVVARVDGVNIFARDLDMAAQVFGRDVAGMQEKDRHDFLVQYLVDALIMSKEARKRGLTLDEEDLQRRFDFLRNKAFMEKLLGTVAQAAITDEAVRKAYDQAVKDVTAEPEVRLRSMLFKVNDSSDEKAVKAAEAQAKEAVARLGKGEDFAKVAEEMTGTASAASFQEATYMNRQQMGREFAEVAFNLGVGAVSAPIRTELGWHVIRIEDKRMRKPPEFEPLRDRFALVVARRAQLELMEKLRGQAKIERLDKVGQAEDKSAGTAK